MADRRDRVRVVRESGPIGFLSLLAFLGALVYFVERATGFWGVVLAVLDAFVWPAIVVFHLLRVLHA